MSLVACTVDPFNDKNQSGTCYKYEYKQEKYIKLKDFKSSKICVCAPFTVNNLHYAFILGDSNGYHIYKFPKNDQSNHNTLAHNFKYLPYKTANADSMSSVMVTDVFKKNRIHIIRYKKYSFVEFKDETK